MYAGDLLLLSSTCSDLRRMTKIFEENWGGAAVPLSGEGELGPRLSNTMWPGPRPISSPSVILIH